MNKYMNFIITLVFGWSGLHKFMQKKVGVGIFYLFTFGGFFFGWFYDCIVAFLAMLKDEPAAPQIVYDDFPQVNVRVDDRNRIIDDCTYLIQHTTTSDVFFSRYDLALQTFSDMGEYVMMGRLRDYKQQNIENFIIRCYNNALIKADGMKTEKGKRSQFRKAYDDIMKYRSELSDHNLDLMEQKFADKM